MPVTPDIPGFKTAMDRLREQMGREVAFHVVTPAAYDPSVQLNDDGEPYDPTAVPTTPAGEADVAIVVGVVTTVIEGSDEADIDAGPSGVRSSESAALIVAVADKPSIEGATSFTLDGIRYSITDLRFDGSTDRWVCFGEAR